MTDEIVDASPEQVMAVVNRMVDLPWPEGDEWLEWEIDGLEGQTNFLLHVLPLASTSDTESVAAWTAAFIEQADRRWGTGTRFDATRFTDDETTPMATYDRRSAPATVVRGLGADEALWWPFRDDAVVLVDTSPHARETSTAAVLVLPRQWFSEEGATSRVEERALDSSLVGDFLSREGSRVMHGVWEVVATRDPEVLQPLATALRAIDRATDDLELGGALASNGAHLEHALDRIRLFAKGTCLCAAYLDHQFYEPKKEVLRGHVRIVEEVPTFWNGQPGRPERICECVDCGRRFSVEEGAYHYPWWKWKAIGR